MFVLHLQGNGLHKNSILRPGLEVLETDFWVVGFVLREIHIHHVPAVGATAILAVKLRDVLERPGEDTKQRNSIYSYQNFIVLNARYCQNFSKAHHISFDLLSTFKAAICFALYQFNKKI